MKPIIIELTAYAKDGASKGCLMAMLDSNDACDITSFAKTNISSRRLTRTDQTIVRSGARGKTNEKPSVFCIFRRDVCTSTVVGAGSLEGKGLS